MTQARPYPFDKLEKYSRTQAQATRTLSSFIGGSGHSFEAMLNHVSSLTESTISTTFLGIQSVEPTTVGTQDAGWFGVLRTPSNAPMLLHFDPYLVASWLAPVSEGFQLTQPLSQLERGALSFLVLKFLEPLAENGTAVPTLSLSTPVAADLQREWARLGELFRLSWVVTSNGTAGIARLWVPGSITRDLNALGSAGIAHDESLAFSVVLGRTALPPETVAALAPSDVLILDTEGLRHGAGYVAMGRIHIPIKLDDNEANWRCEIQGEPVDTQTTELMAKSEVDVDIVVGQTSVSLSELGQLQPGVVLELDAAVGAPVEIRVQGKRLGSGELVDVDGRIGVRLLSRD